MAKSSRTVLDFDFSKKIEPIVREWAKTYGFKLQTTPEGKLVGKRGSGVMMCGISLEVQQTGKKAHLETWLDIDLLTEFASLFMAPQQSALKSAGSLLWREKDVARSYINPLLAKLGQPPIP